MNDAQLKTALEFVGGLGDLGTRILKLIISLNLLPAPWQPYAQALEQACEVLGKLNDSPPPAV